MPQNQIRFRRIPIPTGYQWLLVLLAVVASWFVWPDLRESPTDSAKHADAEVDPVAAALENLRAAEAMARAGPEGVSALMEALQSPNFRTRRNALLALRSMGPKATGASAAVRERIADDDVQVRAMAIDAYRYLHHDPREVSAVAAPLLADREPQVRDAAAQVLVSIGPLANEAVLDVLQQGSSEARTSALIVLRQIGWEPANPRIDELLRTLAGDPELRVEALKNLAAWGQPTPAEIRELLQLAVPQRLSPRGPDAEYDPREIALQAIFRLAPASDNLADVVDLIVDGRTGREQWNLALAALQGMQSAAHSASPRLLEFMKHDRSLRRVDVGWVVLSIGGNRQEVSRLMEPLLLDKDTDLGFHAGRLCASADPDEARRQVANLIPLLTPEKLADGLSALVAVWGLAPVAQEAIPALSRLLESDRSHVVSLAARCVGDIGPDAAVIIPVLLKQLGRGVTVRDHGVRGAFYLAIGKMGPAARTAIPALLEELRQAPLSLQPNRDANPENNWPVQEVLAALVRIGEVNSEVLVEIRRHLTGRNEQLQLYSLQALAQLTPDSPELLPTLSKWLLNSPASQYRASLIFESRPIFERAQRSGNPQEVVELLTALLAENDIQVRKAAAWSLGRVGPAASAALPALKEVVQDWNALSSPVRKVRFSPRQVPVGSPTTQLERNRWIDPEAPWHVRHGDLPFAGQSVAEVVQEAIRNIEGDIK